MDTNAHLKRLEDVTATASSKILELQLEVHWYQSALEQKSQWARAAEERAETWRLRYWIAFYLVIILGAGCTALCFR